MERLLTMFGYTAMAIMNFLGALLIWVGGLGAGLILATMIAVATGSTQARGLTLYNLAAWCPYVTPQAGPVEQVVWTACLISGWVAGGFAIAQLFFPADLLESVNKK